MQWWLWFKIVSSQSHCQIHEPIFHQRIFLVISEGHLWNVATSFKIFVRFGVDWSKLLESKWRGLLTMITFMLLVSLLIMNILNSQNITIDSQLGQLVGIEQDNYYEFRGIPFAQFPLIEENRFRRSMVRTDPYTIKDTIYDATYFRPACIQSGSKEEMSLRSEDWSVIIIHIVHN